MNTIVANFYINYRMISWGVGYYPIVKYKVLLWYMQIMNILNEPPDSPNVESRKGRKQTTLTLEDRVAVIEMAQSRQKMRDIAAQFGVGATQVYVSLIVLHAFCYVKAYDTDLTSLLCIVTRERGQFMNFSVQDGILYLLGK